MPDVVRQADIAQRLFGLTSFVAAVVMFALMFMGVDALWMLWILGGGLLGSVLATGVRDGNIEAIRKRTIEGSAGVEDTP